MLLLFCFCFQDDANNRSERRRLWSEESVRPERIEVQCAKVMKYKNIQCVTSPLDDLPQPSPSLGAALKVLPDRQRARAADKAVQEVSQDDQQKKHRPHEQSDGRLVTELEVHTVGEVDQVA